LADDARAVGLDFVVTTEHNTSKGHKCWARFSTDDLLVIFGQEVVTHTGHWLALGLGPGQLINWDYGVRDAGVRQQLAEVHRVGGVAVAAHPHAPYPSGTFAYPYADFDVVEVWNGLWTSESPWQANNEAALAEWGRSLAADIHRGRWLPAMGNSDVHLASQLVGLPHTVVAAADLSAEAILSGIRGGRSWIAESAAVDLIFTVSAGNRRAGIGGQLDTHGNPAVAHARVRGVPDGTVTIHTEKGTAHRAVLPTSGSDDIQWRTDAAESGFVRLEVRHPGGRMAALTNPITLS